MWYWLLYTEEKIVLRTEDKINVRMDKQMSIFQVSFSYWLDRHYNEEGGKYHQRLYVMK